ELLLGLHLVVAPAHEALDRVDCAPRVGDRLPLGRVAHQALALVGEGDDARRQAVAFLVRNDLDLAALHDGHDRVRRAQVDADDFFLCHVCAPFFTSPGAAANGARLFGPCRMFHLGRSVALAGLLAERGMYGSDPIRLYRWLESKYHAAKP